MNRGEHEFQRNFRDRHLSEALRRGELHFLWQPQVNLKSGALVGAEGLIRWNHPDYGLLSPGSFLPYITDQAVLDEMTRFAIRAGVAQWKSWNTQGFEIPISINVSPLILTRSGFVDWVVDFLGKNDVNDASLTLEITEETLIADARRAASAISTLREAGAGISIDDFGAGYSSLSHLLNYAISEVKIDRYFVEAMATDPRACRIVEALIPLCRELGVTTVGEGVSSAAIARQLRESGCDVGQGYQIGRPMTPDGVLRIARSGSRVGTLTQVNGGSSVFRAAANGIH